MVEFHKSAWLQIHFCVVLWGVTSILGKAITLPALPLVWWRMTIVAVVVCLIPRFWKEVAVLRLRTILTFAGIGVIVAMHWFTFYGAIKLSNASVAASCMALSPIFTALVEPILVGRGFDAREVLFGAAVVPGAVLVVGGTPPAMHTGVVVAVLSAFLVSIFGSLNKRFVNHGEALSVTGLEMAAGAIFLAAVASALPGSENVFVVPNRHDGVLLIVLAIGCTLVPYALSLVALRHLTAFSTALAVNMEPVYAILLAMIVFGEQRELAASFYAGVAIILAVVFSHPFFGRGTSPQSIQ